MAKVVSRKINIYIDQDSALAAQKKLQAAFNKSAQRVTKLEAAGKDATAEIAKMGKLKGRLEEMNGVVSGKLRPSFNLVKKTVADLRRELKGMSQDAPGYAAKFAKFEKVNKQFQEMKGKIGGVRRAMHSLAGQFKAVALGVLVGNTIQGALQQIGQYISGIVRGNAKLSDSLADVRRVTGLTKKDVDALYKSLRQLDTRTSTSGLLNIAVIAGKLGVEGVQNISDFVAATDKLQVALGDELGDADQITTQLGKIINVYGEGAEVTGDALLHIGNAVVDLANKGVASGGFIVNFTQRLAGLKGIADLSLPSVLGLAAGLEESGQRVESSSTAIIRTVSLIASDVPKAAKIAGQSVEEFSETLNSKPLEALLQFATGLQKNKEGLSEVTKAFEEAGADGTRVITTLGVLGAKADFFREKMGEAGTAVQGTGEIMDAFALKNETLGAELDKLGKKFYNLITTGGMKDFLTELIHLVSGFIDVLISAGSFIKDNALALGLLTTALLANRIARIKLIKIIVDYTRYLRLGRKSILLSTLAIKAHRAASLSMASVSALLTGNIKKAARAFRLFTKAIGTNPFGFALAAAAALYFAYTKLIKKSDDLTAAQKRQAKITKQVADATAEQTTKLKTFTEIAKDHNRSLEVRKLALEKVIAINPEYLKGLTLNNIATKKGKEILDKFTAAIKENAAAEARRQLLVEKNKEFLEAQQKFNKLKETSGYNDNKFLADYLDSAKASAIGTGIGEEFLKARDRVRELKTELKSLGAAVSKDAAKALADETTESLNNTIDKITEKAKTAGDAIKLLDSKLKALKAEYQNISPYDTGGRNQNLEFQNAIEERIQKIKSEYKNLNSTLKSSNDKAVDGDRAKNEKIKSGAEKLATDLKNIAGDLVNFNISQYEKQLIAANKKYDGLEARANKYIKGEKTRSKIIIRINKLRQKELNQIAQKTFEQGIKNKKIVGSNGVPGTITDEQINRQVEQFSKSLVGATKRILLSRISDAELEMLQSTGQKRLDAKIKLLKAERDAELANTELTQREVQKIYAKYNQLIFQARINHIQEVFSKIKFFINQAIDVFSAYSSMRASKENQELNRLRQKNQLEKKHIQEQFDRKLISKRQYNNKVEALDNKLAKKQQAVAIAQFKRNQKVSAVNTLIDGASAAIKTYAKYGFTPFGIAAVAALAVTTLAKEAFILSQKPPKYGKGGQLNGPSHESRHKGLPVINPETGQVQAYMEGQEGIVKKSAMQDGKTYTASGTPSQIASGLNALHGGVNWEAGATITPRWMTAAPRQINIPKVQQSYSAVRRYAAGGVYERSTTEAAAAPQPIVVQGGFSPQQFNALMTAFDKKLRAYVVLGDVNEQQSRLDDIQDNATLR